MASSALQSLDAALAEVDVLEAANPSPTGRRPRNPQLTRVIGRACVVLLSSHFERYLYAVNEEAVGAILSARVPAERIPIEVRLRHSRQPIDELATMQWAQRRGGLEALVADEAPLWSSGGIPQHLASVRLLEWMKSPKCREVVRYYRQWGVDDIFNAVTRTPRTRADLWLRLTGLVDKRNNIAHGDLNTEATQADVRAYKRVVLRFCTSADSVLARRLASLFGFDRPW